MRHEDLDLRKKRQIASQFTAEKSLEEWMGDSEVYNNTW